MLSIYYRQYYWILFCYVAACGGIEAHGDDEKIESSSWSMKSDSASQVEVLDLGQGQKVVIDQKTADWIVNRVWQNETGANRENYIFWNPEEAFPSLGIGHFIWYPNGVKLDFPDVFPQFVQYVQLKRASAVVPEVQGSCPWQSRAEFLNAKGGTVYSKIMAFLDQVVDLQKMYIVHAWQKGMSQVLTVSQRVSFVRNQILRLSQTQLGLYAMVDYVNFKGDGLSHSWGIMQVLEEMVEDQRMSVDLAFAASCWLALKRRVDTHPEDKKFASLLDLSTSNPGGWIRRLASYLTNSSIQSLKEGITLHQKIKAENPTPENDTHASQQPENKPPVEFEEGGATAVNSPSSQQPEQSLVPIESPNFSLQGGCTLSGYQTSKDPVLLLMGFVLVFWTLKRWGSRRK